MPVNLFDLEVESTLHKSKHSEILRVVDTATQTRYVLKTNHKNDAFDYKKEIDIHKNLDYPFIIKLVDWKVMDDTSYLLIEYARNGDLFSWLSRLYLLSDDKLLHFFYELVVAVDYLHSNHIVHRDIKPENILIGKKFSPKLSDFGGSCLFEDKNVGPYGTIEYMAPEAQLFSSQDKQIDIWSLGILLYEMFHGFTPFKGINHCKLIQESRNCEIKFKNGFNEEIQNLIKWMLSYEPAKRPTIKEILNHELFKHKNNTRQESKTDQVVNDETSNTSLGNVKTISLSCHENVQSSGTSENQRESELSVINVVQSKVKYFESRDPPHIHFTQTFKIFKKVSKKNFSQIIEFLVSDISTNSVDFQVDLEMENRKGQSTGLSQIANEKLESFKLKTAKFSKLFWMVFQMFQMKDEFYKSWWRSVGDSAIFFEVE